MKLLQSEDALNLPQGEVRVNYMPNFTHFLRIDEDEVFALAFLLIDQNDADGLEIQADIFMRVK